MDGGAAIKKYEEYSAKNISYVPEVLDQVLTDYKNSDIEILLIPGDITKDGEKLSHLDFQKKLQPLKDKGIRVFVVPGNHDINMPTANKYQGDEVVSTETVSPAEFAQIYADCGYGNALSRDAASLSYVAELNKETWLLALDVCLYDQNTSTTYYSGGKLKAETENWLLNVLKEARNKKIRVIGMMHHGLVEHIMMQSVFFNEYIVSDWERIAGLLADNGLEIMFTGHFHANDITEFMSKSGNKIYDVETGSLVAFPFPYRFAHLTSQWIDISTRNITGIPSNPNLKEEDKIKMQKRGEELAIGKIESTGIKLSPEISGLVSKLAGEVFVKHLEGDEVVDAPMRETIQKISSYFDDGSRIPIETIEIDMYPPDNNFKIKFKESR